MTQGLRSPQKQQENQYYRIRINDIRKAQAPSFRYELRTLLHRWGTFLDATKDRNGYPRAAAFTLVPGGYGGHRILCADMPKSIFFVNHAILTLARQCQDDLKHWYAWLRDDEGRWLEQDEKARLMGISYPEFRVKVHRAREELLKSVTFGLYNRHGRVLPSEITHGSPCASFFISRRNINAGHCWARPDCYNSRRFG